jgi:hypothetical protein
LVRAVSRPTPGRKAIPASRNSRVDATSKPGSRPSTGKAPVRSKRKPRGGHRIAAALAAGLRAIERFFLSNVALERQGKNLNVKLVPKPSAAAPKKPVNKALVEAMPLRRALKALLDGHPQTRRVMRHLAFFESALAHHGLKAVGEIPLEALSLAVEQFEALVRNWSDPDLAALRSKMAVAVIERSRDPFYGVGGDKLSEFNTDSRLMVGDASHSMFMELERQFVVPVSKPPVVTAVDPISIVPIDTAPAAPLAEFADTAPSELRVEFADTVPSHLGSQYAKTAPAPLYA